MEGNSFCPIIQKVLFHLKQKFSFALSAGTIDEGFVRSDAVEWNDQMKLFRLGDCRSWYSSWPALNLNVKCTASWSESIAFNWFCFSEFIFLLVAFYMQFTSKQRTNETIKFIIEKITLSKKKKKICKYIDWIYKKKKEMKIEIFSLKCCDKYLIVSRKWSNHLHILSVFAVLLLWFVCSSSIACSFHDTLFGLNSAMSYN